MSGQEAGQGNTERVPLTRMRRAIAATMTMSASIPQFTIERSLPFGPVRRLCSELGGDVRVSVADGLTAACARALSEHRGINASFAEDALMLHSDVHVGLAVALDDGLVTPAILNANRRSLAELASERKRLRDGARAGKLPGAELYGATFSITNLGTFGIERFRALVIPPQGAILAVGMARRRDDHAAAALSCDHRVMDGAPAAKFLARIADLLEDPAWMLD